MFNGISNSANQKLIAVEVAYNVDTDAGQTIKKGKSVPNLSIYC